MWKKWRVIYHFDKVYRVNVVKIMEWTWLLFLFENLIYHRLRKYDILKKITGIQCQHISRILLHCITLYCSVVCCCIVLFCIVLYCIILYYIRLYCIVLGCKCIVLRWNALHCIALHCVVLYRNVMCCGVLRCAYITCRWQEHALFLGQGS